MIEYIKSNSLDYTLASLIFLIITAASCKEEGFVKVTIVDLDTEFDLNFGQTAIVKNEDLNVTFSEVTEDSRCPTDVVCIWEGRLVTLLKVNDQELQVSVGSQPESVITKSGYQITLVKVPNPIPTSDINPEMSEYVITLSLSKI